MTLLRGTFIRSLGVLTIPFMERIKSDLGSENNELYLIETNLKSRK